MSTEKVAMLCSLEAAKLALSAGFVKSVAERAAKKSGTKALLSPAVLKEGTSVPLRVSLGKHRRLDASRWRAAEAAKNSVGRGSSNAKVVTGVPFDSAQGRSGLREELAGLRKRLRKNSPENSSHLRSSDSHVPFTHATTSVDKTLAKRQGTFDRMHSASAAKANREVRQGQPHWWSGAAGRKGATGENTRETEKARKDILSKVKRQRSGAQKRSASPPEKIPRSSIWKFGPQSEGQRRGAAHEDHLLRSIREGRRRAPRS